MNNTIIPHRVSLKVSVLYLNHETFYRCQWFVPCPYLSSLRRYTWILIAGKTQASFHPPGSCPACRQGRSQVDFRLGPALDLPGPQLEGLPSSEQEDGLPCVFSV